MAQRANRPILNVAFLLATVLCPPAAFSADPNVETKPICNAQNRGRLWPEAANTDARAARRAAQCGELQICSVSTWRHTWKSVTVHISQTGAPSGLRASVPGCDATATTAAAAPETVKPDLLAR